jgi:hypothetical protein
MSRRRLLATVAVTCAALALAAWAWRTWFPGDVAIIQGRLSGFRDEVNASAVEGLGTVTRAARIGGYFTEDVVVDLGQGSPPIAGRETIIGMAARLQPRTAAFRLAFDDVGVVLSADRASAEVTLTASFIRRSVSTGEDSMDAREFTLGMLKNNGTWRIGRITAVDTLK